MIPALATRFNLTAIGKDGKNLPYFFTQRSSIQEIAKRIREHQSRVRRGIGDPAVEYRVIVLPDEPQ